MTMPNNDRRSPDRLDDEIYLTFAAAAWIGANLVNITLIGPVDWTRSE